ncbi:MAG: (4Fe-4S)-binding protein [Parasporobacterium sp.]|nr:(4Fe-4S)-binding protein [Parasporobacterium sp.]
MDISSEKIKELKERGFILSKDRNHFSVRILSGNGTMTGAQLRYLADAAERFGQGTLSFTSRLSVEMPGVPLEHIEPLSEFLSLNNLDTGGTGPKIRPVTCCKGTVCVHGMIDTQGFALELHERFYKGWHDIVLPAKFKIGVGGCPNNCAKPSLNDFGISGWTQLDETGTRVPAYKITIGGIWGKTQRIGTPIEGVFTKKQVIEVLEKTLTIWMEEAEPKERFGRYLERVGTETFINKLQNQIPRTPEDRREQ